MEKLNGWIDLVQNDVNGDPLDGGSGYRGPNDWVNLLKTGNLLFQMEFVGDTPETPRVIDAIKYIERHWNDPNPDPGWRFGGGYPHLQACYCLMKGLEAFNILALDLDNDTIPEHDWFDEMSTAIVNHQIIPPGLWPGDHWGGTTLATEWALLTLERVVPPMAVPVDIKPQSCRNPFNVDKKGVMPVAILGTEEFDVTQIDPASIRLEGVAPLRWALEDVATPFEPYIGKEGAFACTTAGPDGYLDLTLKFDAQEIAAEVPEPADGEVLLLWLTGRLKEEFGGKEIVGQDVVVILRK
jgi:hypothetical protein